VDRGTGWGYQLEAEARYDFTPNWSAGGGARYWHALAGRGNTEFVHSQTKVELNDFTSERFGVFGDVAYRFATFKTPQRHRAGPALGRNAEGSALRVLLIRLKHDDA
jgi:hypothetical protein